MTAVTSAILRIAALLAFVPLAAAALVFTVIPSMLWAFAQYVVHGADEARTDRILLNPAVNWACDTPMWLFQIAARRKGTP